MKFLITVCALVATCICISKSMFYDNELRPHDSVAIGINLKFFFLTLIYFYEASDIRFHQRITSYAFNRIYFILLLRGKKNSYRIKFSELIYYRRQIDFIIDFLLIATAQYYESAKYIRTVLITSDKVNNIPLLIFQVAGYGYSWFFQNKFLRIF